MSTMTINGRVEPLPDDPENLLIDVVRDALKLTGTKLVCGAGVCGACTVLVDGAPVVSCLMPARAAAGKSVTTVEGIGAGKLHPVQKAFMAHDALQCGFCTPGFIVEATAFHDRWRATKGTAAPSREDIGAALSGHLCRCGAYDGIFHAVTEACEGRFDGDDIVSPRVEAREKVTGAAKYTVDIRHDGQLEGIILRSHVAHARITELDLAPARAISGVSAAISLLGDDRTVRYVGEPVAAIAAKDRKTAVKAGAAIKINYEPLPSVIGLDAARKPDAPVVFEKSNRKRAGNVSEGTAAPAPWKGNVRGPSSAFSQRARKARNWIAGAREAQNPLLVEQTFRTDTQSHACLEPHATVARFDGYRPATEVKIALLPSEQGDLKALSLMAHADTGAAVNSTLAALARLIYPAEAKELADYDVISNLPAGAPFRGPGGPPMAFALEQAIDEAALRMKVDPIGLRKRWDPNPNRQRLYDWASGLEIWRNAKPPASQTGRYRRGVGVATGYWLYLWQPGYKVELKVKDGRLIASTATQDIGQGSRTVIANTVAHEFGLEPHEIEVHIGDSNLSEGPGSAGSRTTASVIPPTLLAIGKLKAAIEQHSQRKPVPGSNAPWRDMIAASPDISVSAVRPEDGKPMSSGVRSPMKEAGFMGIIFGWMMRRFSNLAIGAGVPSSVQVIEVEVDTWLGHVRVLNVHTGIAVGKIAAPALAHSQAAGSVIQGIGYALYEAREIDARTGDTLSAGMEDYGIPGMADTPPIDVHFDEGGFDHVLGGSVGIGEVATVPTSPAIANAIRNATGIRFTEIDTDAAAE